MVGRVGFQLAAAAKQTKRAFKQRRHAKTAGPDFDQLTFAAPYSEPLPDNVSVVGVEHLEMMHLSQRDEIIFEVSSPSFGEAKQEEMKEEESVPVEELVH